MRCLLAVLISACALSPAGAQEEYGAKGIYAVYEASGQWVIFDKNPRKPKTGRTPLAPGGRFLVVGSSGSGLFFVARASATYGGSCRNNRPLPLRAALLKGPRRAVGTPIIGIKVPRNFRLEGSRAKYLALDNEVGEEAYARLADAIKAAVVSEVKRGAFRFERDDAPRQVPRPEQIQMKIDFGARLRVRGRKNAFVLVGGAQVASAFRRCLRLADGDKLVGECVEMPHALMAETALLRFVAYDPGGQDNPYLLAYTPKPPLWGDERWGFAIRGSGARLFLADAMDPRCREGF